MEEVFEIALANPIRFIFPTGKGSRFDTTAAVDLINSFQSKKCYFQKWTTSDSTRLQLLSDFPNITCKVYELYTNAEVLDIAPIDMDTQVLEQTFSVYEIPLDFSLLDEGEYYMEITYEDNESAVHTYISEPLMVREDYDEPTVLLQYRNSDNNFSVIFDTDIVFDLRVEGLVTDFNPESDDVVYNDQKRNATLLDSIPYRTFTLYVGNAEGVASWMADKVNRAFACNIISVDGDYYEKTEGASWEISRAEEYAFIGMQLNIMPVENRFLETYKTGNDPGEVTIVQKYKNYSDVSGDITMPGTFKDMSLLEKICIVRTGLPFTLNVGITDGGDEIGSFLIDELVTTVLMNYRFTDAQTLYLTGITEASAVNVIWKQLDESPIPTGIGGGGSGSTPTIGKGFMTIFHPQDQADFDTNFNVTTGLGNVGTSWEGWALADGRNGTQDMGDYYPKGWKSGGADMGTTGGANEATLTDANMPEHDHHVVADGSTSTPNIQADNYLARTRSSGGNSDANLGGVATEPTLGLSSKAGQQTPDPISTEPVHKIVLWVEKIA